MDTSLVVSAFSDELMSPRSRRWLEEQDPARLAISDRVVTEVSSAMAIKLRTGRIGPERRSAVMGAFNAMVVDSLTLLPITGEQFRIAARFSDREELGVRAGDALHLACASVHGATLHTLDRRLAEAGAALGLPTRLLE